MSTSGADSGNDCYNPAAPCLTIQNAVDRAQPYDEVRITRGLFGGRMFTKYPDGTTPLTATIVNTKSLQIRGAWDATFTGQDLLTNLTILSDTAPNVRGIYGYNSDILIEGFDISGRFRDDFAAGSAVGVYGGHAEIRFNRFANHIGTPALWLANSAIFTITGNTITGNANTGYDAGGIVINQAWGEIRGNKIISNTAPYGAGISGYGFANPVGDPSQYLVRILDNDISYNRVVTNVGNCCGDGGGIRFETARTQIVSNTLHGNSTRGCGSAIQTNNSVAEIRGNDIRESESTGGCGSNIHIYNTTATILSNTMVGGSSGYAIGAWTTSNVLVAGNVISGYSGQYNSGIGAGNTAELTIERNVFIGNNVDCAGAAVNMFSIRRPVTLTANLFERNTSRNGCPGAALQIAYDGSTSNVSVVRNIFASNVNTQSNSAMIVSYLTGTVLLEGNVFTGNIASSNGALTINDIIGDVTLRGNTMRNNVSNYAPAGKIANIKGSVRLEQNTLIDNNRRYTPDPSTGFITTTAFAIEIANSDPGLITVTNNLMVGDRDATLAMKNYVRAYVNNNTFIANNARFNVYSQYPGGSTNSMTLTLANNIMGNPGMPGWCQLWAENTKTAAINNLRFNNYCTNGLGTFTYTNDIVGTPLFDPNYRLLVGSPGIDVGDPAYSPPNDRDGLPRPIGAGPDIGAFEYLPSQAASPVITGTFRILHAYSPGTGEELGLKSVVSATLAAQPGLSVSLLYTAFNNIYNVWNNQVAAGGGPDLYIAPNDSLGNDARSSRVLNLDPYLTGRLTNVLTSAIEGMKVGGTFFGVPESAKAIGLLYNKLSVTVAPSTTAGLLALVQAGKKLNLLDYLPYSLFGLASSYGGTLLDADQRCIAELGGFDAAEAYNIQLIAAGATTLNSGQQSSAFISGTLDMVVDGPWNLVQYRNALGSNLGVAPLPAGPGGIARPMNGIDGFYVNPHTANPAGAVELALWLTNQASSQTWTDVGGHVPVRTDVTPSDPRIETFAQISADGYPRPQSAQFNSYWGTFYDADLRARSGAMTPRAAYMEACGRMNKANGLSVVNPTAAPNWIDEFGGRGLRPSALDPRWSWVREDGTHWSLSARPGYLRLSTQQGGVFGVSTNEKNLLTTDAPLGNYEIRARLSFTPAQNYQAAGLLLYTNDDNWMAFIRAFCNNGGCASNALYFDYEVGGAIPNSNYATTTSAPNASTYLRVVKEGNTFLGYVSGDGVTWYFVGAHNASFAPAKIGLRASNGDVPVVPEISADFDSFGLYNSGLP